MSEIKTVFQIVKKDFLSKTGVQTLTLFSSQILTLALGVLINIINTRALGPAGYGILTFFFTFTGFTVLFFRFGLASSIGLMLAETEEKDRERELIGAAVAIAFFIGVTYSLFTFISSFFVDDIFHTNVGWILRYVSVLVVALPFTLFIPQIGRGTNQIVLLSMFSIIPYVIYILGALILLNLIQMEPLDFILLNLLSTLFGILILIYTFHPKLTNFHDLLKQILKKNKEYGFHLYLGQISDQSTYKLDGIFITIFVNTTQLGFYSLAQTITSPMSSLSQAMSTSMFRDNAHQDRIPKKVFLYNFIWLALCGLGLLILGPFLITMLFGEHFLPVKDFILPLTLAGFFQGMYQPQNMFLGSKGRGKWLRNISISQAIFNLIGNFIFIYYFGVLGAAIASMIATFISYLGHVFYYNKYIGNV
jgi:O-antigen/teichoic acid export membrane protein